MPRRGKVAGTGAVVENRNSFYFIEARRSRRAKFRFKLYYASTTFPLRFSAEVNGKTDIIIVAEKPASAAARRFFSPPFSHSILHSIREISPRAKLPSLETSRIGSD